MLLVHLSLRPSFTTSVSHSFIHFRWLQVEVMKTDLYMYIYIYTEYFVDLILANAIMTTVSAPLKAHLSHAQKYESHFILQPTATILQMNNLCTHRCKREGSISFDHLRTMASNSEIIGKTA